MKLYIAGGPACDSMRMYIAGTGVSPSCVWEAECAKRILISFAQIRPSGGTYEKYRAMPELNDVDIFMDSGAFSAFTKGQEISVDTYSEWLLEHKDGLTVYAALDVIGDPVRTRENIERMETYGLHPIPTFHSGSPISELDRLLERYDYIAFGGLVPLAGDTVAMARWLNKIFARVTRVFPKKIHLFGVTTQWVLERYPAYSCDSTSAWVGAGQGRNLRMRRAELITTNALEEARLGKDIFCADGVLKEGSAYVERRKRNVEEARKFESYLTALWASRGVVWEDEQNKIAV